MANFTLLHSLHANQSFCRWMDRLLIFFNMTKYQHGCIFFFINTLLSLLTVYRPLSVNLIINLIQKIKFFSEWIVYFLHHKMFILWDFTHIQIKILSLSFSVCMCKISLVCHAKIPHATTFKLIIIPSWTLQLLYCNFIIFSSEMLKMS